MKRRDFISGSLLATTLATSTSCTQTEAVVSHYFELRRYQPMWGMKRKRF